MVMLVNYILSFFWLDPVLFKVMFHKGSLVALRSHGSSEPSAFIFPSASPQGTSGGKVEFISGICIELEIFWEKKRTPSSCSINLVICRYYGFTYPRDA